MLRLFRTAFTPLQFGYPIRIDKNIERMHILANQIGATTDDHTIFPGRQFPNDLMLRYAIACIQTDNGFEFTNEMGNSKNKPLTLFEKTLVKLGIRHKKIKPFTPRHNGKVERSHRKDNEEFYREIQVNLAYRWFLGYGQLDTIPHFATVSYAFCKRFPEELTAEIFEHILNKALNNRMLDPSAVFID